MDFAVLSAHPYDADILRYTETGLQNRSHSTHRNRVSAAKYAVGLVGLIGSIRRECLNHYIILNARHLKETLSSYFRYYHESRTHLSLDKQCPFPRPALKVGKIVAIPQLGGLHHRYERTAA